jgi:hypothetical protein
MLQNNKISRRNIRVEENSSLTIKEKGKTECFALSHCQNIKTTTAYEKNLFELLMNQR